MATRNLSKQLVWSRFIVLAIWSFLLKPIVATLPVAAQNIDLGSVTTILDGANLEQYFSQEDIAASNANSLVDFLGKNSCLVMSTGGTGSQTNVSIGGYAGACIKVYVDGVLANNPNTGEFDWNTLALESISSITIHNTPILGQEEFAGTTISISTKSFSDRKISTSFSTQNVLPTFNQLYWNYAGLVTALETTGTSSTRTGTSGGGQLIDHGNPHLKTESGYSIRLKFASTILNQDAEEYLDLNKWTSVWTSEATAQN